MSVDLENQNDVQGNTDADSDSTATDTDSNATDSKDEPTTTLLDTAPEGAPEVYEDFVLPEGAESSESFTAEFGELAKGSNLSQEDAQKFVDLAGRFATQMQEDQLSAWQTQREQWVNDLKSDKEFGGDAFKGTLESANRALRRYGSKSLIDTLNSSGVGDNAELVKLLARVDKATREDKTVEGSAPKAEKSKAETLFGKSIADSKQ